MVKTISLMKFNQSIVMLGNMKILILVLIDHRLNHLINQEGTYLSKTSYQSNQKYQNRFLKYNKCWKSHTSISNNPKKQVKTKINNLSMKGHCHHYHLIVVYHHKLPLSCINNQFVVSFMKNCKQEIHLIFQHPLKVL